MNMRSVLISVLFLAAAACAPAQRAMVTDPHVAATLAGQKLFEQHCAACHGADAAGTRRAPNLRERVQTLDAAFLFGFITNGDLRRGMPSWSRLPDERRWQIVTYLKSLEPSRAAR
ncbi:MAG TPA: cytochrome c [Thermoanaerobaculia bacterium]|jgi:mono/diheme cytochrome c family protein|nr:cytochrome c [Thermoanaerobaculia bacterium]